MSVGIGLLCFCGGVWLADWAWKFKIREKARTGIRLECWGQLYNVTSAQQHSAEGGKR